MTTVYNIDSIGLKFKGTIKTPHINFPKDFLEDTINHSPYGTHIFLESANSGNIIYVVGYNYNLRKVICFISASFMKSHFPGKLYKAQWCNFHGYIHVRIFPFPQIISSFFDRIYFIEIHNHDRQCELGLEKSSVLKYAYFRLSATSFGIVVRHKSMIVRTFTSIMFHDML